MALQPAALAPCSCIPDEHPSSCFGLTCDWADNRARSLELSDLAGEARPSLNQGLLIHLSSGCAALVLASSASMRRTT